MNREVHVRICGRLGAKFPGPTRQEETEPRQTGLRRLGENLTNCHREAKVTAPLLDSTGAADKAVNLVGCKSPHHQLPERVVSISDACGGNEGCSART